MKLEIEITEEEIKSAIERKVRVAVADQTNQWSVDNYIKEQVKLNWQKAVDALVVEALASSGKLKTKIAAEVERKLKAQIASAMKVVTTEIKNDKITN